ncbi:TRAP-type mannitol/chloroaromatic compound transport system substrate-binding protein [Rhodothalassium salexigens DSM 2132]|uniref:TRAP-type mannitol/chloroaromatic compound transport system substrate-binding protein n=1 Tax=Rhodothalassium salexigens DSM 2132 TaxID=1188247 RepID=A0A4R2PUN1_RHOSA|nr:TRAP transporter substrate-binding protein [Rhodothalassium salexigens]MBB4210588.1 TRAP-type mannitol/chloroaromatic compound transport system substrate-binding protein [Rhodothalassium salexigens DSM 2132]MBK1639728.1 ABC transporter substrate-binding protein [Rhodothalassium salexigens DSM 2132]TCP37855.1 TRAP-type mannitol/chloroaromatic compound transport system substrate-binding protein [Rhodothalassium salexigens DSM 2132]
MADAPHDPGKRTALKIAALAGATTVGVGAVAGLVGGSDPKRRAGGGERAGAPAITGRAARELRLVTTWPKNFPGLGTGAQRFADRVTAITEGRLTVKLYAAGELVPAFECFDAVAQGNADMYHAAEYYWQGRSPAFNFFCAVPYGLIASEQNAWLRFGGGQELWDRVARPFNIKGLPCGNTGLQMGGWFKRPIRSLDDFRGLKIRMPGLGGELMRRLGATPVTKSGGELYQALDQGNIDATEWVGPWNDMSFGFHRIAKWYHWPGIHEPGSTLSVGINLDLWEDLRTAERVAVEAAAAAENDIMFAEYNQRNAEALARLVADPSVQLVRFPDPVMAAMAEAGAAVLETVARSDDANVRDVYRSFLDARTNIAKWGDIAERAFVAARALLP